MPTSTGGSEPSDHRFFHGSPALLEPGDRILPGAGIGASGVDDDDHVYVCEALATAGPAWAAVEAAAEYGAMACELGGSDPTAYSDWCAGEWRGFFVYEVEPIGAVTIDPRGENGFDRRCAGAVVERMVVDNRGRVIPPRGADVGLAAMAAGSPDCGGTPPGALADGSWHGDRPGGVPERANPKGR